MYLLALELPPHYYYYCYYYYYLLTFLPWSCRPTYWICSAFISSSAGFLPG